MRRKVTFLEPTWIFLYVVHWGPFERKIYDPMVHGVTIDGSPKIYSRHTGGGEWSAGCTQLQHIYSGKRSFRRKVGENFLKTTDEWTIY